MGIAHIAVRWLHHPTIAILFFGVPLSPFPFNLYLSGVPRIVAEGWVETDSPCDRPIRIAFFCFGAGLKLGKVVVILKFVLQNYYFVA